MARRDLITSIKFKRCAGDVVIRNYAYDNLTRPISRQTARNGTTQNDSFGYNSRGELISAALGNENFAYNFDEIGNQIKFACNSANETTIEGDLVPAYDADGNATLIKTATGTWSVSYNAENRPIRFECTGTQTVVEMNYDYLGRRFEKKITVAGTVVLQIIPASQSLMQSAPMRHCQFPDGVDGTFIRAELSSPKKSCI